jgi:hypothetical protein
LSDEKQWCSLQIPVRRARRDAPGGARRPWDPARLHYPGAPANPESFPRIRLRASPAAGGVTAERRVSNWTAPAKFLVGRAGMMQNAPRTRQQDIELTKPNGWPATRCRPCHHRRLTGGKHVMSLRDRPAILAAALACSLLAGCASEYTNVAPLAPQPTTKLGPAKGSACGTLAFLGPITNFIPVGLNDRVQDAYRDAVASVPGATGLVNVTMQENWTWWILATTRCVTITGEAIK